MLIWLLVAGGASVDAPGGIIHDHFRCESPRQYVLRKRKEFAKDRAGIHMRSAMMRWGRAPTEQWFQDVESILCRCHLLYAEKTGESA